MLTIPLVLQYGDGDKVNNFGHPRVLRVPNCVKYSRLEALVRGALAGGLEDPGLGDPTRAFGDPAPGLGDPAPGLGDPTLVLVDDSGERCSRCEHGTRCVGCPVASVVEAGGEVVLKPADKLAVRIHSAEKNLIGTTQSVNHKQNNSTN